MKPALIIITGKAATGKTTLGKWLSKELGLPFINKDLIKSAIFSSFGEPDLDLSTSRMMGAASHNLLNKIIAELVSKKVSLIVDAPFTEKEATPVLKKILKGSDVSVVQILLMCDENVLVERYIERAKGGTAHHWNRGLKFFDSVKERLLNEKPQSLSIPGQLLCVDTTDLSKIDYQSIAASIRSYLKDQKTRPVAEFSV